MIVANRLNDINEYYFSKKLRQIASMNESGYDVINLGIGSPDMPPHPEVIKTLQESAANIGNHAYQSYRGSPVLLNAIAQWYQKHYKVSLNKDTEVLPLIGSKEGIMHICMTWLNDGDVALVPDPGYPTYHAAVKLAGGIPVTYNLTANKEWLPDFAELEALILQQKLTGKGQVKLMFVNYPHMPSGKLPDESLFARLVDFAGRHRILLVNDNPYSFILNDEPLSIMQADGAREVALELNSLSKSHNMAGWRVGMLVGSADEINEVIRFKSNMDSGMFLPVQLAAAHALSLNDSWNKSLNGIYKKRQEAVFELLDLPGCRYDRNQAGMFVWAQCPANVIDGFALSDQLLADAAVFVTPGGIFGKNGLNFIRVSLCNTEEKIQAAIHRIKAIL